MLGHKLFRISGSGGANPSTTIASSGDRHRTNQLNIMNNSLLNPVLAVVMGTGFGMLLSVAGQKMVNAHAIENCWRTPNRQLVHIRVVQGDAWYCLDKRYLN